MRTHASLAPPPGPPPGTLPPKPGQPRFRPAPLTAASPPPLSPAYVKDTIAALTASRRSLGVRLDGLDLFGEKAARPDDPLEVQLLFQARDDYLTATIPGARAQAMSAMAKLLSQAREACAEVASEMNRLFIAAMSSETSQKKITAMLKIAEAKAPRKNTLTLAEMLEDADALTDADQDPHAPDADDGGAEEAPAHGAGDDQAGCADELQAQPGAVGVPAE